MIPEPKRQFWFGTIFTKLSLLCQKLTYNTIDIEYWIQIGICSQYSNIIWRYFKQYSPAYILWQCQPHLTIIKCDKSEFQAKYLSSSDYVKNLKINEKSAFSLQKLFKKFCIILGVWFLSLWLCCKLYIIRLYFYLILVGKLL